jgi:hypothetical protein
MRQWTKETDHAGPEIRMTNKQYQAIYALADAGINLPI